jgi:hypothetical protein
MFNEGNQIHNFMSSSGSGTVLITVPVPTFSQVTVPVPVPLVKKCSTTLAEWEMRLSREGDEIYPSG